MVASPKSELFVMHNDSVRATLEENEQSSAPQIEQLLDANVTVLLCTG